MLSNLPKIVKKSLGHLPRHDYPTLNTFLFVSCWLNFAMDAGITSMRDLFYQLNLQGIKVDISTFSKASKHRSPDVFEKLFQSLIKRLKSKYCSEKIALYPLDSTVFCDLEKRCEYRLATNLPLDGEMAISNEEIGEIYRQRWQIELLGKFLKMHLKLDRIITQNINGITLQIYASLIAYILLLLVEIPREFGSRPSINYAIF